MQTMADFQVETHFSTILEQVEKGEQVTITKDGRSVARLIPIVISIDRKDTKQNIQRIKKFGRTHTLGGLDWKTLRDEGRR